MRKLLMASVLVAAAGLASTPGLADGIKALVTVTQEKANNANDDALNKDKKKTTQKATATAPRDVATGQASGKRMHKP